MLKLPASSCSLPFSVPYLRSFEPMFNMYTIYKSSVQTLDSQPSNHQGNPSEVLSCAGIQNLNKLIKSWGESETEQLAGLLAVHGWSVPWKGTSWLGGHSPQHPIGLWYPMELLLPLFSRSVMSDSFATPWTVAHQAPLFMGFSRQEYRSGFPSSSPEDFPDPGIELMSSALADGFSTTEPPGKSWHCPTSKQHSSLKNALYYAKTKECYMYMCTCTQRDGGIWGRCRESWHNGVKGMKVFESFSPQGLHQSYLRLHLGATIVKEQESIWQHGAGVTGS